MDSRKILLNVIAAAACFCAPAWAQSGDSGDTRTAPPTEEAVEMPPTELDLPIDESIKMKVEPFVSSPVVDRLIEPTTIVVGSPNTSEVEIFVVPVDAPYGGKALEKPHSVGKDDRPADGFRLIWTSKESAPYVKVFAVVTHKTGIQRRYRSHTMDFGMGGSRLETPAKPAPTTAPSI
jgi:hypothetical protein